MGHLTNIVARLCDLERAQVIKDQVDRKNTREKKALQAALQALSATMDDVNERPSGEVC